MVREIEGWFTTEDGMKLFEKTWVPENQQEDTPVAHMVYIHGFNDRCEINHHLFPTLASFNIQVHGFDQRGWGKSVHRQADRGLTGPTSQVLADIHEFVRHTAASIPGDKPLFIMGHSMGGQETLHYILTSAQSLLTNRPKLSGVILEGPYIMLDASSEPNSFTVMAGKIAAKLLPKFQLKQKLDDQYITHDPVVNKEWKEDPLCHDIGTLEGLRDMLQRAADLHHLSDPKNAVPSGLSTKIPYPILWTHGTADKICAIAPSRALFDRLEAAPASVVPTGVQAKTFKGYEGAYHKVHCENNGVGEGFAKDVGQWIRSVVDAQKSGIGNESAERAKL